MVTIAEWVVDELDSDLARRRRELVDFKLLLASATGARADMLARSCQVMVYAHWEGFVKHALRTYLTGLVKARLNVHLLQYRLQSLCFLAQITACANVDEQLPQAVRLLTAIDSRGLTLFAVDPDKIIRSGT